MQELIEKRIQEIRERAEKASAGPWRAEQIQGMDTNWFDVLGPDEEELVNGENEPTLHIVHESYHARVATAIEQRVADIEFIAHAREDIPFLLEAIAAAESQQGEREERNCTCECECGHTFVVTYKDSPLKLCTACYVHTRQEGEREQVRNAALEEAAMLAEKIAFEWWRAYKGHGANPSQQRADPDLQGRSDGGDEIAAAIRALKATPLNGEQASQGTSVATPDRGSMEGE